MKRQTQPLLIAGAVALLVLAACGGGSGGTPTSTTGQTISGASAGAMSSGTVSAFGSVFVNGHEFSTASAKVIDDDAGTTTTGSSSLEVGMSVDVKAAGDSTATHPDAAEIHLHPLVRGIVDGSDATAGTLTVMGQSVQLTASTNFSDHRACLTATTAPCTAITGQSGLVATTGSGSTAVAGNYVTVHGFLYSAGSSSGSANVVATLVSVADAPTNPAIVAYKAEGPVSAVGTSNVTIGGLTVDLSAAKCYSSASGTSCANAFSVGQVVSAIGATAPALPATTFAATTARLRDKLVVQTAGASIEVEGKVSSVTASPASFVVRGITVDASALTSGSLPALGDVVEVLGTVATGGTTITASSVKVLHAAITATYGLEGDATSVTAGSAASTYVLTVLGQPIAVDATTRLADRSVHGGGSASSNPFNIDTFQTYLAASSSQHLLVRTQADGAGNLSALSVTIAPASTVAGIGGTVDATPAPVNSTTTGTPSTFAVHGLAVSADPASVVGAWHAHDVHGFGGMKTTNTATVAAGDLVLVRGTFANGTLTVAAPTGMQPSTMMNNLVFDYGAPSGHDHDGF